MATFGQRTNNTPTNTTTNKQAVCNAAPNKNETSEDSDRIFIGCFSERNGKYGKFYKAIIDGFEFYLSETKNLDKFGNVQLKLMKSKTPYVRREG
jgi:hypothetical protein